MTILSLSARRDSLPGGCGRWEGYVEPTYGRWYLDEYIRSNAFLLNIVSSCFTYLGLTLQKISSASEA